MYDNWPRLLKLFITPLELSLPAYMTDYLSFPFHSRIVPG